MKKFLDEDFLLSTETARKLYREYAENMPIIDYHCHINPADIALDKEYENITEIWLGGDHYKWRAMRSCGIDEKYITGDASDYEKFLAFASVLPKLIGSPIYIWSHLELKRYFDYHAALNEKTAPEVWKIANAKLRSGSMSAKKIIKNSSVKLLCTTDDPVSDLEYHKKIKADKSFGVKVLPAFRPDKGMNIERKGYMDYIRSLEKASGIKITDFASLKSAYNARINHFDVCGCKTADHGFDDYIVFAEKEYENQLDDIISKAFDGKALEDKEICVYKTAMMQFFASEYKRRKWVMQIHFGVKRNANTKMLEKLGVDSGFDIIHGKNCVSSLADLLDSMEKSGNLPKTVLYSINPSDNAAVAALCGAFQTGGDGMPKVVQGSAWWFNDNESGMREQMLSFANLSALGCFLGMLTDSRSFLSYTRHEYFRRILCDILGRFVENGEYPNDVAELKKTVQNICYFNTKRFFDFDI